MSGLSKMETLHVFWAFFFQLVLITHFALRRWAFDAYIFQYGWIVYALAIPAVIISIILLRDGQPWYFWLSGFLYFVFAVYGYTVEYVLRIEWRNPVHWPIFGPYITLYLGTIMFYWWPLARLSKGYWLAYTFLFIISTILNIASHR